MRRAVILTALLWSLWPTEVYAVRPGASTGVAETADTTAVEAREVIKSVRGGYVHALSLLCTTAPCEVGVFDSTSTTSGSGTVRWELRVATNNGTVTQDFAVPLVFTDGITMEVAGTGGRAFIAYE